VPAEPEQDRREAPDVVVLLREMLFELRVHVILLFGDTVKDNVTVPVKPWRPFTVIVEVPVEPARTVTLVGLLDSLKS
jgi:hypothetical protein